LDALQEDLFTDPTTNEVGGESRKAKRIRVRDKVAHEEAVVLAAEVIDHLEGNFERAKVLGSILRGKKEVGDIEILLTPRFEGANFDAHEQPTQWVNLHWARVLDLIHQGVFAYRLDKNGQRACGPKFQRLIYKDVGLDLFCQLAPAQWGVLQMIRTGSEQFTRRCVTQRAKGGLLPNDMRVKDSQLWRGNAVDGWTLIPTPEEKDFFEVTGILYRRPEDR